MTPREAHVPGLLLSTFMLASLLFAQAEDSKWTFSAPSQIPFICSTSVTGKGGAICFQAYIRVVFHKKETFLDIVLPRADTFNLLDLKSLSDGSSPTPGGSKVKIKPKAMKSWYTFNASGEFFEDEANQNIFSCIIVIPSTQKERGTLQNLLKEASRSSEEWEILISHKGRVLHIPFSFQGACDQLKQWSIGVRSPDSRNPQ